MTGTLKLMLLGAAASLTLLMSACSGESEVEKNLKAGEKFLAENAEKEGVVVTDTGLQYIVIEEGEGNIPSDSDKVKCYYKGMLIDGTVFDATEEGSPVTFAVDSLIKGFREALLLMPEGSKWRLFMPQYLGYGPYMVGNIIPAYSALIFEVELIEIL